MTRALALFLCIALAAPGCATTSRTTTAWGTPLPRDPSQPPPDRTLLTTYLKQLPLGSKVRARLIDGSTVRGTLMKAGDEGIVVQTNARLPEPPRTVPIDQILAVDLNSPGGGVAKAVGIGVAVGVGTFFSILLLLTAIYGGD
jgi:hypothetical protein